MGAYYAQYINTSAKYSLELIVEQGQEIGKDGQVYVHVNNIKKQLNIEITGSAVYVNELKIEL
ncbi:PhzF family phenazine biosynthesis protein, partial [Mammaliicoccus sciuri]|uniref:PhzF family phenazine biosynthesis protein n=1 Tax=Mammaliicoccus sciuri TaxID=1296 RepID=UPI00226FDA4C